VREQGEGLGRTEAHGGAQAHAGPGSARGKGWPRPWQPSQLTRGSPSGGGLLLHGATQGRAKGGVAVGAGDGDATEQPTRVRS